MILKKIILKNYRNYTDEIVELDPNVNFITGKNAQGKTNLIESIYYASYGKSFRNGKDMHLIRENESNMYFGIEYESMYGSNIVEVKINSEKKKEIRINRQPINRISELIGQMSVIIFVPDDLKIIKEGPTYRRKFIDRQISLIDRIYYSLLVDYNRVISQRNNYLRKTGYDRIDRLLIETFDEKLAEYGSKIILKRMRFIARMNEKAAEIHQTLTDQKEMLEIRYLSSILSHLSGDYGKIEEEYLKGLKEHYERDIRYQTTHFGPHRDDLDLRINQREIKIFGSQGQIRTATLSMILSVLNITREEIDENPILLLDDVFSELDQKRKNMLVSFICDMQTLITATDLDGIDRNMFDRSTIFEVSNGRIRRA